MYSSLFFIMFILYHIFSKMSIKIKKKREFFKKFSLKIGNNHNNRGVEPLTLTASMRSLNYKANYLPRKIPIVDILLSSMRLSFATPLITYSKSSKHLSIISKFFSNCFISTFLPSTKNSILFIPLSFFVVVTSNFFSS